MNNLVQQILAILRGLSGSPSPVAAQQTPQPTLPAWTQYANPEEVKKQFGRYPDGYNGTPQPSQRPDVAQVINQTSKAAPTTARPEVLNVMNQPKDNTNIDYNSLTDQIKRGLRGQLGRATPIENNIPQFVEAAKKYDIFRKNPFLLPQIAILESSGGLNVTRDNNPLNWGARLQATGQYSPRSWPGSINDAITAIAGARDPSEGDRYATSQYYQPFRDSNDLKDFVKTYEPANPSYYDNLIKGIQYFQNQK